MADQIEQTIRLLRALGRPTDTGTDTGTVADAEPGRVIRWVRAESERRCADGDSAYLGDLGVALLECHQAEPRAWQYLHTFDHLFKLLAGVCGGGDLSQALRLIAASRAAGHDIDRLAAALLVADGPGATLSEAIEAGDAEAGDADGPHAGDAGDTFRACVVHEIILREGTLTKRPAIAEWAASAAMRRHPLGWLPLELADIERGWDQGPPCVGEADRRIVISAADRSLWPATDATTPAVAAALSSAVMNWAEDSHGEIEARVFDLGEAVTPATVPEALAALGLECLEPGMAPFSLAVFDIEAHVAWWLLLPRRPGRQRLRPGSPRCLQQAVRLALAGRASRSGGRRRSRGRAGAGSAVRVVRLRRGFAVVHARFLGPRLGRCAARRSQPGGVGRDRHRLRPRSVRWKRSPIRAS